MLVSRQRYMVWLKRIMCRESTDDNRYLCERLKMRELRNRYRENQRRIANALRVWRSANQWRTI